MPCDDCSRAEKCPPCVNDVEATLCRHCPHTRRGHSYSAESRKCWGGQGMCPCPGFEPESSEEDHPASTETRCDSCSHALTWHDSRRIPPCTHLVEGHDCNCLGFEEPGDDAAEAAYTGCAHESWEVLNQWPQDRLMRSGSKWYKYRRCATCGETLDPLLEDEPEHLDIYGDDPICPCRECREAVNEAPEGPQAAPEAPSRPPLAVVYRIAGEGFYELLVPGDAVVSVQDGALAISHPDRPVTGLMQVRPHGETP